MELTLSRRQFFEVSGKGTLGTAILVATASMPAFILEGCSNIYNQVVAYVGVGIQAFQAVVNLLSGAGIISLPTGVLINGVLTLVKAGFADVQAAVAAYDAAPAASKATLAGKISTALLAVQSTIQQFWTDVKIPDASLANTVAGLLGLIVSTIAGFIAALPVAPTPAPAARAYKSLPVTPKVIKVDQFRKQFNAILGGGNAQYAI